MSEDLHNPSRPSDSEDRISSPQPGRGKTRGTREDPRDARRRAGAGHWRAVNASETVEGGMK